MELTVIGKCGAYPKAGEAASCYLISNGDTKVLLDIGSGSLSVMQKYLSLPELDAVIISHFHPDHYSDVFCLQHAILIDTQLGNRTVPVQIYSLQDNFYFSNLDYEEVTMGNAVSAASEIRIGGLQFSFRPTVHKIAGLSVKVTDGCHTFVYTGDTAFSDHLVEFAAGCDLLLAECTIYRKYEGMIEGHLSGRDAGRLAEESGAGQLILTHLPVYGDNKELLEDARTVFAGRIQLAEEGLCISAADFQ